MKICIAGYYGVRNTGDDLLLHVIKERVLQIFRSAEISVLGKDVAAIRSTHSRSFQAGEFKDVALVSGWQGLDKLARPPALDPKACEIIANSDVLIIGGGGLLGNNQVFAAPEVKFAKQHGTKVMLLGVGVNPFGESNHETFRPYFKDVDLITTRDHWSWHNLRPFHQDVSCTHCVDPVLSMGYDTNHSSIRADIRGVEKRNTVGLVLSHTMRFLERVPKKRMVIRKQIRMMVNACRDSGFEVELYSFSPRQKGVNDTELCNQVNDLLGESLPIREGGDILQVPFDIASYHRIIGDRFHSLVLAAVSGTTFVGVALDSKQREFSRMMGMPWFYPHKDTAKIAEHCVYQVLEQRNSYVDSMGWASEINYTHLHLLLIT